MSVAVFYRNIFASDTLLAVAEKEYADKAVEKVIPPSLRIQRMLRSEGGRMIQLKRSHWVFAVTSEEPGSLELVQLLLEQSGAGLTGDLDRLCHSEPEWPVLAEDTAILAVHRGSREVRFFKKRMLEGRDVSIFKKGLSGEQPYAIGSGAMLAMQAMKIQGQGAINAVLYSTVRDLESGGGIYWLNIETGESGLRETSQNQGEQGPQGF
ncbi:hypothetical protein ACQZV8_10040 [Magnetococcales bacterium HHB-1]